MPPPVKSPTTAIDGFASSSGYLLLPRMSDQSPQTSSRGMPFQVRDERVPVAEQHRTHHLHQAIAVVAGESQDVHDGSPGFHAQQPGLGSIRGSGSQILFGPLNAYAGAFQLAIERQRRVGTKRPFGEAGAVDDVLREVRDMDADGNVVGTTYPSDTDQRRVRRKEVRVAVARSIHGSVIGKPAGWSHASSADLLGETGQLRQRQFHRRNGEEGAAPLVPFHDVAALELPERLLPRRPADPANRLEFLL